MPENIEKIFFSFKNAFRGLAYVFKRERNFQIEIIVAVLVVLILLVADLKKWEEVILIFIVFAVLILEILNTSVERLVNLFKPKVHPYARIIKDIAAATVLLASVGAVIIAWMIFWPYLF